MSRRGSVSHTGISAQPAGSHCPCVYCNSDFVVCRYTYAPDDSHHSGHRYFCAPSTHHSSSRHHNGSAHRSATTARDACDTSYTSATTSTTSSCRWRERRSGAHAFSECRVLRMSRPTGAGRLWPAHCQDEPHLRAGASAGADAAKLDAALRLKRSERSGRAKHLRLPPGPALIRAFWPCPKVSLVVLR